MTWRMVHELQLACDTVASDPSLHLVVVSSADPEFWISHFDVDAILRLSSDEPAPAAQELHPFHRLCLAFQSLEIPTVAVIDGRVGGGGAEFASALDMRFGSIEGAVVSQMEVPLGILPGGGATQRLPFIVGPGRAAEMILTGCELSAVEAEAWGWLNRALPRAELDPFVTNLSDRLGSFDRAVLSRAKEAVGAAGAEIVGGLRTESRLFEECVRLSRSRRTMQQFLQDGGQTRVGERVVGDVAWRASQTSRQDVGRHSTGDSQ